MPQPKNTALRVIVPIVVSLVGLFVAYSIYRGTTPPKTTPSASTPATSAPAPTAAQPTPPASSPSTTTPTSTAPASSTHAPTPPGLHAMVFGADAATLPPLGSLDPQAANPARLQVEFSPTGAGIARIRLAEHFEHVDRKDHMTVQREVSVTDGQGRTLVMTPFSALAVQVGTESVPLVGEPGKPVWRPIAGTAPGAFEAIVVDGSGANILRVTRTYSLGSTPYAITLRQSIENLSPAPLSVRWYQMGPVDLAKDELAYVGDRRRLRFGYLLDASHDPTRAQVVSNGFHIDHASLVRADKDGGAPASLVQWPNKASAEDNLTLVWMGLSNRYFGAAVLPLADVSKPGTDRSFPWVQEVNRAIIYHGLDANGAPFYTTGLRLDAKTQTLAAAGQAGASADFSQELFAGPLAKKELKADPLRKELGLDGLILYNMGGPCSFCTFAWLAEALIWLLRWLHDTIWHDWAFAIITLVVIVRTILHPVTKWSQIRMTRFGKQMAGMGPKMKILQERFKDNPKQLQVETAKLWREEGVSPAGFLGCLPMFLQTPVWIALYATLFFAVELRHQSAFYGVFQKIQPAGSPFYQFLWDLSEPDRLLRFGNGFKIPLLGFLGTINSLNILPLLLGIVFFIQQKYLSPPTTTTLTPEQEMQQKMMKWMTVFLFPLFMYNAPAGLALYFITNSTIAIFESRYIRSHIDKYDKKNPPGSKKQGKGFMQKLMEAAEARQKAMQQEQQRQQRFPNRKK